MELFSKTKPKFFAVLRRSFELSTLYPLDDGHLLAAWSGRVSSSID